MMDQFAAMDRAAIDACSIIYLLKTGVFEGLAALLPLVTTDDVYRETGWPIREGKPSLPVKIKPASPKAKSNDQGIFLLAREEAIPLISDDLEVLTMAREAGLDYYNSLMMLVYLVYRERISPHEYSLYRDRLLTEARYSNAVIEKGDLYYSLVMRKKS